MQGIGKYGLLNKPDEPTQSRYLSQLDPPYRRYGDQM
jgi:hypothetical protein